MKKLLLTSVAGILAVSAAGASIAPYVSVKGGYANQKNMLKLDSLPVDGVSDLIPLIAGEDITLGGLSSAVEMLDVRFNTDNVWSFNPAVGIKFDFDDARFAKFRLELEYLHTAKAKRSAAVNVGEMYTDEDTNYSYVMPYMDINANYNFKNTGVLLNAYMDFQTGSIVNPFVSAGIGYGHSKFSWGAGYTEEMTRMVFPEDLSMMLPFEIPSSWSSDNLIWSVGAGLSFDVMRNLAIDAQYRYIDYGKVSLGILGIDLLDIEESAHQFTLGARYTF